MNNIEKRYKKLTDTLTKTQIALRELVKECPHESITESYFGDSGNYDRSDDYYGVTITCNHCHGRWVFEQSEWFDACTNNGEDKSKALRERINAAGGL